MFSPLIDGAIIKADCLGCSFCGAVIIILLGGVEGGCSLERWGLLLRNSLHPQLGVSPVWLVGLRDGSARVLDPPNLNSKIKN